MKKEFDIKRLEIKQLADEVRFHWMKKGVFDVIDILNEVAIVIRCPHVNSRGEMFSGFSTYIEKHFVTFINSRYTLGHERFTAAHELYHILYDKEILMNKKIIPDTEENEQRANRFAIEFLMPEEGVMDFVHKRVNSSLKAKHIIRLQNHFKVSYKAMLKRLLELGLCTNDEYQSLVDFCSLENTDLLKQMTIKEGFSTYLIEPSNTVSIPNHYLQIIIDNYENNKISYGKLYSLLKLVKKSPVDFGYPPPSEVFE